MMWACRLHTSFPKLCIYLATAGIIIAQQIPDTQSLILDELDHLFVDIGGLNDGGFTAAIQPCSNYDDVFHGGLNNNSLGQQTSAEWIRAAFHDFATADVAAGTGGLDASLAYETDRLENIGNAMTDSLFFFSFFRNKKLSMADLIACGAAIAVGSCGGPYVPLRGGRIDATEAGPPGVCGPETDLEATLNKFEAAGFNQADTIALTACGHTMGGVHHTSFPDVVSEVAVSSNNADGRESFDDSVAIFDTRHIHEYLDGTGHAGGPLVTAPNKTVASDLRLFSSDKNETMKKLASSADEFASTCSKLIARMIDTVPKGVSLTPVIEPPLLKLVNTTLSVNWNGDLKLSASIRYIKKSDAAPAPDSLKVSLIARSGKLSAFEVDATSNANTDLGTTIFGQSRYYHFYLEFPAATGLSGLRILDQKFPLQDSLFVAYTLSSVSPDINTFNTNFIGPAAIWTYNITAAFLTTYPTPLSLTATFAVPTFQPGILNPKIDTSKTVALARIGEAGPYTLYSAITTLSLTGSQLFGSSVDITGNNGIRPKAEFFKLFSLFFNGK